MLSCRESNFPYSPKSNSFKKDAKNRSKIDYRLYRLSTFSCNDSDDYRLSTMTTMENLMFVGPGSGKTGPKMGRKMSDLLKYGIMAGFLPGRYLYQIGIS